MQKQFDKNTIILTGEVAQAPHFSHDSHGVRFDTFPLRVPRLSGAEDLLNILAPSQLLEAMELREGENVKLFGAVRTFNNHSGVGSRLVISVHAKTIERTAEAPENRLSLSGALCKLPVYRTTPMGREICELMLAANRNYGRSDYLPCIAWGSLAVNCRDLPVGTRVTLDGRLQSRIYHKEENGEKVPHTAFEVSVMSMGLDLATTERQEAEVPPQD